MILLIVILFFGTLLGGLSVYLLPGFQKKLKYPLIFGGSYLFAITIIHIIPELFSVNVENSTSVGLYILVGFFMQQFLEYFSFGIEHGHLRVDRSASFSGRFSILTALIIHSLLEGALLTHDSPFHGKHESYSLLLGIMLHKIPAALALMVTMSSIGKRSIYLLILFSLASPLGLILETFVSFSQQSLLILFAIVCGSFLHISTTIFVETSLDHSIGLRKMLISMLGTLLAIIAEYFV